MRSSPPAPWLPTSVSEFASNRSRLERLAGVSAVALGLVFLLILRDPGIRLSSAALVGAGWVLMPPTLLLAAWRPELRRLTLVPAGSVWTGVAIATLDTEFAADWSLLLAGLSGGGLLGAWLWLGWIPAPRWRTEPQHPFRWALIACHVGSVAGGLTWLLLSAS